MNLHKLMKTHSIAFYNDIIIHYATVEFHGLVVTRIDRANETTRRTAVLMDVLGSSRFSRRWNSTARLDGIRRSSTNPSASPLSSKIARDACSNYCKPPLWRLVHERSICVWTWNRAREIRLSPTRALAGDFSRGSTRL